MDAGTPQDRLREASGHLAAGRHADAQAIFSGLVEAQPGNASLWHALALSLKGLGRTEEAGNAFVTAMRLQPGDWKAGFHLGAMLEQQGEDAFAERAYRMALAANADALPVLGNLGNLLRRAQRGGEAAPLLERAARLAPADATALGNLSLLRLDAGQLSEARTLAERAAALAPDEAAWWEAAGTAARLMPDPESAVPLLERAAALAPDDAGVHFELALAREACADDAGAREAFAHARRLAPDWTKLEWAQASHLPLVVDTEDEGLAAVARFEAGLARLHQRLRLDTPEAVAAALDAALATVPFALHYLRGDHAALQGRFASLVASVARAALPQGPLPAPRAGRLRIGFASSHLRTHVVARFFGRSITSLDPRRFERFAWSTGGVRDAWTAEIAGAVDHFVEQSDVAALAASIRAASLDVLVYLDIGMDPLTSVLASLRLAPVQATFYGHPVTTGLDTIDCFLSGDALEPAGAESHYSENLVRLPGIGALPRAPDTLGDAAWLRALRTRDKPLLVCAQNLMKVPPAFDAVFARIAAKSGARMVFFDRAPALTRRVCARLARAFTEAGANPQEQLAFEPARPYRDYLAGLAEADLVLDTPGFSGGGTSLDAIGVGAAVLAIAGDRARARQTEAMLRIVGTPELIARDAADYERKALALLAEPARLVALRERILLGAVRLFSDTAAVTAFAGFLERAAVESRAKAPT